MVRFLRFSPLSLLHLASKSLRAVWTAELPVASVHNTVSLQIFPREELFVTLSAHKLLIHRALDTSRASMDLEMVDEFILENK